MKIWRELPNGPELEELPETKEFSAPSEADGHINTFLGPLRYVIKGWVIAGVNVKCLEFVEERG